jgi:hypothetical protein
VRGFGSLLRCTYIFSEFTYLHAFDVRCDRLKGEIPLVSEERLLKAIHSFTLT